MSKLNRENIKKALECCQTQYDRNCDECPYERHKIRSISAITCESRLRQDLISLINSYEQKIGELTEENEAWQKQLISTEEKAGKAYYELACEVEDLRAENERLIKYLDDHFPKCIYQYDGDVQEYCVLAPCGQFRTVAEFQKQIEADTVRKMQERLKAEIAKYFLPSLQLQANVFIDQIAKEMLEGEQK